MGSKAFVIAGGEAATIANDTADFRYRATSISLAPSEQTPARTDARFETQFMVEDGLVAFMIGGASVTILAGDFVRVAPGTVHACRNVGDVAAHLLVRSVSSAPIRRALSIVVGFAA